MAQAKEPKEPKTLDAQPMADAQAEAAADEKHEVPPLTVKWRDAEFKIPQMLLVSPRFQFALASDSLRDSVYSILEMADPAYPKLFLAQCKADDNVYAVAAEFFEALNGSESSGNS